MKKLKSTLFAWKKYTLLFLFVFQMLSMSSHADFVNGNFEDSYPNGDPLQPITGWTLTGYLYQGATTVPPTSIADLNLTASGTAPQGISDMVVGPTQSLFDYFLFGATPTPTQELPLSGTQSASINLRSINTPYTVSGTGGKPAGWTTIAKQATSISQQIVVQASDFDPTDGLFHVRFKTAGVMENPTHAANEQPFAAVQLNNITTGRTGANPLFFEWIYSAEPGIPWYTLTTAGTNSGSNIDYLYSNIRGFDISQDNTLVHVGDTIELVGLASGCSLGGHDGHLYLDDVQTGIPQGLWITVQGPTSAAPGQTITYTYSYINNQSITANNVSIEANLPTRTTTPTASVTFVSVTTPTAGTTPSCTGTGPVNCSIGTLLPNQSGTFQMVVTIPGSWTTSQGPVNNGNYSITDTSTFLLGHLFQTSLVSPTTLSNLVVDVSGLANTATVGIAYTGSYTCSNPPVSFASGDAPAAVCDVTNLPTGLSVSGCTITPSSASWVEPATIPTNQTVTCNVAGTPTATGSFAALVTANAANNTNSTTNHATATIIVSSASVSVPIPATLDGSPVLDPAVVCCGRPVLLGPLPIPGSGITIYSVVSRTGSVSCFIGNTGTQTYLKVNGRKGSCTIVGEKNGVLSAPLTITSP